MRQLKLYLDIFIPKRAQRDSGCGTVDREVTRGLLLSFKLLFTVLIEKSKKIKYFGNDQSFILEMGLMITGL